MDYFAYLSKKLENEEYQKNVKIQHDKNNTETPSIFENGVQLKGQTIFEYADTKELSAIDFSKILHETKDETQVSPIEFVVKEFFSFDDVKKEVDKNADGEISEEEAKNYLKNLAGMDKDSTKLSIEDFTIALNNYKIDLEKELENFNSSFNSMPPEEMRNEYFSPFTFMPFSSQLNFTPSFNFPNYSFPSYSVKNYQSSQPAEKTIETMSLDELQEEKTKRESILSEKQDILKNAQAGKTETIKAVRVDADKAKKVYMEALDKDKIAKPFKNDIKKNLEDIAKNKEKADKNNAEISKLEFDISKQEESIKTGESNLAALLSALETVNKKTGDAERDKKNAERVKSIQTKIDKQKKSIKTLKKQLEKQKNNLEKIKGQKSIIEKTQVELEEKKAELEARVEKECSKATQDALKAFNEATKKYETIKAAEVKAADEDVEIAKKAVIEVNEKINVATSNKIKAENCPTPTADISQISASDIKRYGVSVKTMPDGTQVLACRWSKFDKTQPELISEQKAMLQAAAEQGFTILYSDVTRTVAESNYGRKKKGSIVCAGGQSPHNYGAATDIVVYKNGKVIGVNSPEYEKFAKRAVELSNNNLEWGGEWRKKGEKHHFNIRGWDKKYKQSKYLVG